MTDRIPARTIGLVDLHNNACSLVGSVIDQGDVVLIGDSPTSQPYAVLMPFAMFAAQGGAVYHEEADEPAPKAPPSAEPQPEPVKGAEGLWACCEMGCPHVVAEPGTFCGEHAGIYMDGAGE